MFDEHRLDHPQVNGFYTEIDKINQTLAKLNAQLSREKSPEPPEGSNE